MLSNYVVVNDKVVAAGKREAVVFTHTARTEDKLEAINVLKVASKRLDEDEDKRNMLVEMRQQAKKNVLSTVPFYGAVSLAVSYLCAHLSVVPYDGDVTKLLTSFGVHAAILTGATVGSTIYDNYKNCTKKDILYATGAIVTDKQIIDEAESVLDDIELEEPITVDEEEYGFVDYKTTEKRTNTKLDLGYVYYAYNKEIKKAYLKGKLPRLLRKIGFRHIDKDIYEEFISRIEESLYCSNSSTDLTREEPIRLK
ncbi:MAG: hypothetical protein ACI4WW_03005 [Candidatus Coprovivens sp.]